MKYDRKLILYGALALAMAGLTGCGAKAGQEAGQETAGTFAAAAPRVTETGTSASAADSAKSALTASSVEPLKPAQSASAGSPEQRQPEADRPAAQQTPPAGGEAASATGKDTLPAVTVKEPPAAPTEGEKAQAPSVPPAQPEQAPASPAGQTNEAAPPAQAPAAPKKAEPSKSASATPAIQWAEFFDNEKQDRPSEKFWDLSDQKKTVEIKGYMGEVLSLDKHWFLLIPQPGAECPFDNGDETYWNKIMIVYVPDTVKLRYTSGPLKITGRLDVGIKVDESGYKTMFRLYDASFEKIKE
ncbi:hypothetical protein ACFFNY_22125 [Paenibacillus hodogayensis]|uniref:Lipoprotein n=1 Tax=Paenibacillus hodogayensis TaxID=279208 RepID=A0ABV5W119_9BACL